MVQKVKNRFFTICFHALLHGDTGGYMELEGVRGGHRGLKDLTAGYR